VTLVWAVPAVAAALATAWVLARARALEDAVSDLAVEARALRRMRAPLAGIRRAMADTDALAAEFRAEHAPDDRESRGDSG
jgi:hypothetical protein